VSSFFHVGFWLSAILLATLTGAPGPASSKQGQGPGDPQGGQNACEAAAGVEESLECSYLLIDIASLYLDSIDQSLPRDHPTLVRDRFTIENGMIKEVEVIFLLID
jgi:hypothetical protein